MPPGAYFTHTIPLRITSGEATPCTITFTVPNTGGSTSGVVNLVIAGPAVFGTAEASGYGWYVVDDSGPVIQVRRDSSAVMASCTISTTIIASGPNQSGRVEMQGEITGFLGTYSATGTAYWSSQAATPDLLAPSAITASTRDYTSLYVTATNNAGAAAEAIEVAVGTTSTFDPRGATGQYHDYIPLSTVSPYAPTDTAKFFGLTPGTTYYFKARAIGGGAESAWNPAVGGAGTALATLDRPASVPATPTFSSIVASGRNGFLLTFGLGAGAVDVQGFKVYRGTAAGGPYVQVAGDPISSLDDTQTTFTDAGLAYATTYYYIVKAWNYCATGGGLSAASAERSGTTLTAEGIPTAPSAVTLVSKTSDTITISWTDNSDNEAGFYIYRKGPNVVEFAFLDRCAGTQYTDAAGLAASTTYQYKVSAYNDYGESAQSSALSVTTDAAPAVPTAPTLLVATSVDEGTILLAWRDNATTETGYKVYRGLATASCNEVVATLPAGTIQHYDDYDLDPNTTYYYVVRAYNAGGDSAPSNEASATTADGIQAISRSLAVDLDPRNDIVSSVYVGGRLMLFAPYDRPVVVWNNWVGRAGLKPHLSAPAVSAASGGLLTGTFTVRVGLLRTNGNVRSAPGPASSPITLTNQKIVVAPPLNAAQTQVQVRDTAYDWDGNEVAAADYWEVYLYDGANPAGPVCIAQIPVSTAAADRTYTCSATLQCLDLYDGTRRPAALTGEYLIAPAVRHAAYNSQSNRVMAFGEAVIRPTDDELRDGAYLSVTQYSRNVTAVGWKFTDALYHKELFLGRRSTGWYVSDVINDTTLQLAHSDAAIQDAGISLATAYYTDFAFGGNSGRIFYSAYFAGEAGGLATFCPETFPPLTTGQSYFDMDDLEEPNGAITSKNAVIVFKPSKIFYMTGGSGLGADFFKDLDIQAITKGSGLVAAKTLCRDRFDQIWFMSDQGVHTVRQSGLQQMGLIGKTAFLLQQLFDVNTAATAVGAWFAKDDYLVVAGLDRIGSSGRRSGFLFDSRTNSVMPLQWTRQLTALLNILNDAGEAQLLAGDKSGYVLQLFVPDQYTDDVNYTLGRPYSMERAVSCYLQSGVMAPTHAMTPRLIRPHVELQPNTDAISFTFAMDEKYRADNPGGTFTSAVARTFASSTHWVHYSLAPRRMQAFVARLSWSSARYERVMIRDVELEATVQGRG